MRRNWIIRCERCGMWAAARYLVASEPEPPVEWSDRAVPYYAWRADDAATEMLLCGECTQHVDATMRSAWSAAIARVADESEAPQAPRASP